MPSSVVRAAVASGSVATLASTLGEMPPRLSPGFVHRFRPGSVARVHVAFAAGLALGSAASRRSRRDVA